VRIRKQHYINIVHFFQLSLNRRDGFQTKSKQGYWDPANGQQAGETEVEAEIEEENSLEAEAEEAIQSEDEVDNQSEDGSILSHQSPSDTSTKHSSTIPQSKVNYWQFRW
jgi:hypothetical protein